MRGDRSAASVAKPRSSYKQRIGTKQAHTCCDGTPRRAEMLRHESMRNETEAPLPVHADTSEMAAQQNVRSRGPRPGMPPTPAQPQA